MNQRDEAKLLEQLDYLRYHVHKQKKANQKA